jgi:hypothetical protein
MFRQVLERPDGHHCIKEPCAWEDDSDGRKTVKTTTATPKTQALMGRPPWKALEEHYQNIRNVHLRSLFADDSRRYRWFKGGQS